MHQIGKVRLCHVSSCTDVAFSFLFTSVHLKSMINYLLVQRSLCKTSPVTNECISVGTSGAGLIHTCENTDAPSVPVPGWSPGG